MSFIDLNHCPICRKKLEDGITVAFRGDFMIHPECVKRYDRIQVSQIERKEIEPGTAWKW